jgi:hypothetical protein
MTKKSFRMFRPAYYFLVLNDHVNKITNQKLWAQESNVKRWWEKSHSFS